MRKLGIVILLLIPFLIGCEPVKQPFYGAKFTHNGYQFELPPANVIFASGPAKDVYMYYPISDTALVGQSATTANINVGSAPVGVYLITPINIQIPYYNKPTCSGSLIESHGSINILTSSFDEFEAIFEFTQTFHNTCDTNLTCTNKITNGYIHKKNN